MKIVSWNVRGLGGPEKRREVKLLVAEKKSFMFVSLRCFLVFFDVGQSFSQLLLSSIFRGVRGSVDAVG